MSAGFLSADRQGAIVGGALVRRFSIWRVTLETISSLVDSCEIVGSARGRLVDLQVAIWLDNSNGSGFPEELESGE